MWENRLNIAYLRLSLEDAEVAQGKSSESNSIVSQRLMINNYIKSQPDLEEDFIEYIDDGHSRYQHKPTCISGSVGFGDDGSSKDHYCKRFISIC